MKIYYNNIRGVKSKINSLKEIIDDQNPHIISLSETLLGKEENIEIKNYKFMYNSKKEGKGGIAIGIRKDVFKKCMLIEEKSEEYEATWIRISNNDNINVRIGTIYAPQESKTKKSVIEKMYNNIKMHKLEAEKRGEKIIISGDFNTKIGDYINGNKKEISKYGRMLLEIIKNEEMEILNTHIKCEGLWTRMEGGKKSVIDYVLINKEDTKYLNQMIIDDNKIMTPFHIIKGKTIYSDHCAIIIQMNWYVASKDEQQKYIKVVNNKTLTDFKRKTSGNILTKIVKQKEDIKEKYRKWNNYIKEMMNKCFNKKKGKREAKTKTISNLYRKKRKIKREYKKTKDKNKIRTRKYKIQKNLINEYIEEEEKKTIKDTIDKNIKQVKMNGGLNSNAFWEFKKQMDNSIKKEETISTMINEEGKIETEVEKIKIIFEKFYTNLFKPNKTESSEEDEESQIMQHIIFESIETIAKHERNKIQKIQRNEIIKNIKKLKKKNTCDSQGWNNKMLLNSGEDVEKSIQILFDEIETSETIPNEWIELIIKSIFKGKGQKNDVENRRGLFISNTISKLYERIKLDRNNEKLNEGISKYQCGGTKGRSTVDHIMTLNAIIDYNKTINSETYILFADAYKCFDKLDLKNCIIDLYKIIGATEAMRIYRLNEKGKAIIKTPVGEVGPIEANKIVRQGTILGPKLCCINTDKVNKIGKKCITYIGPKVKTESLIYVDDIQNASSNVKQLENAVDNLKSLENKKGYLFNNDVKKTAILIVNKKKKETYDIKLSVRKGEIKQTKEYKYLGEWFNEKGDHTTSLTKRKEKIFYYIKKIKLYGNEFKIGKYALMTRIKIYKTVVIPSIFHNIETWSYISKKEMKELEKIQATIVRRICEQRITTTYYGLISELGIWPIEKQIEYKKIMILHNILTTKGERTLKEIIEDQITNTWKGCWIEQVKEICENYDININNIKIYTKLKLKELVKSKIHKKLDEELKELKQTKTKLRFLNNFNQETYLNELTFKESIEMIKIRLNMIETKCNYKSLYKNNLKCELCRIENDTTEHLLECRALQGNVKIKAEDIMKPNKEIVRQIDKIIKRREELGYKIMVGGTDQEDIK